jgi:hypothetical protein
MTAGVETRNPAECLIGPKVPRTQIIEIHVPNLELAAFRWIQRGCDIEYLIARVRPNSATIEVRRISPRTTRRLAQARVESPDQSVGAFVAADLNIREPCSPSRTIAKHLFDVIGKR